MGNEDQSNVSKVNSATKCLPVTKPGTRSSCKNEKKANININVKTKGSNSKAIEKAFLYFGGPTTFRGKSDKNGLFNKKDISVGDYKVDCEKHGYSSVSDLDIHLSSGDNNPKDIQLDVCKKTIYDERNYKIDSSKIKIKIWERKEKCEVCNKETDSIYFYSGMSIDVDGAANCYGPLRVRDQNGEGPIEYMGNGGEDKFGNPGNPHEKFSEWGKIYGWAYHHDAAQEPYYQSARYDDPYPKFFISTSAFNNPKVPALHTKRPIKLDVNKELMYEEDGDGNNVIKDGKKVPILDVKESKPPPNPKHSVDSRYVQFISLPSWLGPPTHEKPGNVNKVHAGDFAVVIIPGKKTTYAVLGDFGGRGLGEGSIALAKALGKSVPKRLDGKKSATDIFIRKTGIPKPVIYIIFPNSHTRATGDDELPWPGPDEPIENQANINKKIIEIGKKLYDEWGGERRLKNCFPELFEKKENSTKGRIKVAVKDIDTKKTVEKITVELHTLNLENAIETDKQGSAVFNDLDSGDYTVFVHGENYTQENKNISLTDGAYESVNIEIGKIRRIFFVIYLVPTGKQEDEDDPYAFLRAALTWKNQIEKNYSFVFEVDFFMVERANSAKEFKDIWQKIFDESNKPGSSVFEGNIFSHSSDDRVLDVPVIPRTKWHEPSVRGLEFAAGEGEDGTISESEIKMLPVLNWHWPVTEQVQLTLSGCNTGRQSHGFAPAATFAKSQTIKTIGNPGYSYFSTRKDWYERLEGNPQEVYLGSYMRFMNQIRGVDSKTRSGYRMDDVIFDKDGNLVANQNIPVGSMGSEDGY